jgi:hypothetical protein
MSGLSCELSAPFLLGFLKRIEPKRYEGALARMRTLSSSYDEETQTSEAVDPEAGGTSATYTDDIATGLFGWDTKRTDW